MYIAAGKCFYWAPSHPRLTWTLTSPALCLELIALLSLCQLMRVMSITSRSLESGWTCTTSVTTSGASVSPSFFAESIATSPLAWGELVKACVDGEIVETAAMDPRLEFGADKIVEDSGPTLPALTVQHRNVPRPSTRRSSATSRSALRSAFI